ncbi:hypothetical protein Tco_0847432 [Tanacetum coccineum]
MEEIALKHLGKVSENTSTSTLSVNNGSESVNTGSFDPDDSPMPELKIFHKSETGIFYEGVIIDFNSLPTEIEVSPTPTLRINNIHPKSQILGDPKSAVQTRSKVQQKSGSHALISYIQKQQRNNHKDQHHQSMLAEILKKFDLVNVKTAITPMETKVALTKDEEAVDVDVPSQDVHISKFVKRTFNDYGGSNLDRKSTTGGCQFLGQRLISWQCKKQTIVATSTTEAEYVAAANCCGQVLWVQNQLLDYGFNFMNTKIHIDNESTILHCEEPQLSSPNKAHRDTPHFKTQLVMRRSSLVFQPRVASLERISSQTKLDNGECYCELVKKVKTHWKVFKKGEMWSYQTLKGKNPEASGRKVQDDPLVFLVQEEVSTGYAEGVNTGSIKVSTVSGQVSTDSIKKSIPSPDKGQREGKAPMIIEEAHKKTKEQVLHEEASLAEAIILDTLEKEEKAKQDLIRAKIEANAELSKSVLRSDLQGEDSAKKMVELVNQRKKHFVGERARAKRNIRPMTVNHSLRTYMYELLKNQGHWKLIAEDESKASKDVDPISGTNIPINPVHVAIKPPSIATYKIIKQGKEGVYQIVREDGTDIVYGMNGPEDELEKVLCTCRVHCLNLESSDIYMLTERKYPLTAEVCKAMLDKKLQGGKPDEDCYKLLKWMEKQAGIRK